jgi:hypothetical protein
MVEKIGSSVDGFGVFRETYSNCVLAVLGRVAIDELEGLEHDTLDKDARFPSLSFVKVKKYSPLAQDYTEGHLQRFSPNSSRRDPSSSSYFQGASLILLPGLAELKGSFGVSVDHFKESFKTRKNKILPATLAYYPFLLEESVKNPPRDSAIFPVNEVSGEQIIRYFFNEAHLLAKEGSFSPERLGVFVLERSQAQQVYQKRKKDLSAKLGISFVENNLWMY